MELFFHRPGRASGSSAVVDRGEVCRRSRRASAFTSGGIDSRKRKRPQTFNVMAGLVPAIHVFLNANNTGAFGSFFSMSRMTDPTHALVSFQKSLTEGAVKLQPAMLDPALFVHLDKPNGHTRFTYVYLENQTVIALAMMVAVESLDGLLCFQAGVAVPEEFRGKGLAKKVLRASIAELKNGLARNGIRSFAVEGIVSETNVASKKVSEATISKNPKTVKDEFTGEPALQYVLKISG